MAYSSPPSHFSIPLWQILRSKPQAIAVLSGSEAHPRISGTVQFYETGSGVLVLTSICGLPAGTGPCDSRVFGLHIHEGGACTGTQSEAFSDALGHLNPAGCPHPYHAGDLPPAFSAAGQALGLVLTDRFSVDQVLGRTVILHEKPDDFTTQPAGNAGKRIACGVIRRQ